MNLGRLTCGALAASIASLASATHAKADSFVLVDAGRGPVEVYYPDSYDPSEPLPLVMALHGYDSSGAVCESRFQLRQHVDTRRFIYLSPDGSMNSQGTQFWNATGACCDYEDSGVDDSSYLQMLVTQISAILSVDDRRISTIGYSNGGFMSHRLACEAPQTFAAIVSVSGLNWEDAANCPADEPVHALQIHGTDDSGVPYGPDRSGHGAESSVEHWALLAHCDATPDESLPDIDLRPSIPGNETSRKVWGNGNPGGSAELWTIWGGTHQFNFVESFGSMLLDWLDAHPKPEMSTSFCQAGPNSVATDGARISFQGYPSFTSSGLELSAHTLPPNQFGIFFGGSNALDPSISFGNGYRCIHAQGLHRLNPAVPIENWMAHRDIDLSAPPMNSYQPGDTRYFQFWYRDPNDPNGAASFNLSDGVEVTFWP